MKIVFLDAETVGDLPQLADLQQLGEVTLHSFTSADQTLSRIHDADVVLTNKVVLDRPVLENAPQLKLICVTATGMNNVDVAFAQQRGIRVKNAVGYAVDSVAQHTFALLLALLEQLSYYDSYVKSGLYAQSQSFTHIAREFWLLKGKRLGIIGLGNIGRGVAAIAEAFGMSVVYYSASGSERPEKYTRVSWEELLRTSDVISVHAPLTDQTRNLVDYMALTQMKQSAILLNTGRGGIINESDLSRAIDEDRIAGAGLDVFEKEPLPAQSPLLQVKNTHKLLLTPHIAWTARETREQLMAIVVNHIRTFVAEQQAQQ